MPICVYKNIGETPLQTLDRLRLEKPELAKETLSYAGRLDPMAEGLMLVLVGDENQEREKYLSLDKTYEVEILFGFATDTYDTLGLITESLTSYVIDKEKIKEKIKNYQKTFLQPYPKYSSKSIASNFSDKVIPPKEVTIYDIEILDWREIFLKDLLVSVKETISRINGGFRQDQIVAKWEEVIGANSEGLSILKIRVDASSGAYMRSLAHVLGQDLGIPALALRIKRTKVGSYTQPSA